MNIYNILLTKHYTVQYTLKEPMTFRNFPILRFKVVLFQLLVLTLLQTNQSGPALNLARNPEYKKYVRFNFFSQHLAT
jgi:hypothetical protein